MLSEIRFAIAPKNYAYVAYEVISGFYAKLPGDYTKFNFA